MADKQSSQLNKQKQFTVWRQSLNLFLPRHIGITVTLPVELSVFDALKYFPLKEGIVMVIFQIQPSTDLNNLLSKFLSPQLQQPSQSYQLTSTEVTQTITHSSTYVTKVEDVPLMT